jgi:hypothetical protein
MGLRDRILSPFATYNDVAADADINGLIRRVLLSDALIMESARLSEFPSLIRKIGFDRVIELLNGPGMWLKTDPLQIGDASQARTILADKKPNLPLYHFDFGWIVVPDQDKYLEKCFSELDVSGLRVQQIRRLHRAVWDALIARPPSIPLEPINQLLDEAEGHPAFLKRAVHRASRRLKNTSFDLGRLTLAVTRDKDEDAVISIESNLAELCGRPDAEAHKLWQATLMGIGRMFHRIAEMKGYEALSGFTDEDMELFLDKLGFLIEPLSTERDEAQFQRLIRIAQLPTFDLASDRTLDVDALFKLRQSSEIKEFRVWLKSAGQLSDAEIEQQIRSLRSKLGNFIDSTTGNAIRFVVSTGIGMASPIGGMVYSALDTFLLNKLLPKSGIAAFVSKQYTSLFDKEER